MSDANVSDAPNFTKMKREELPLDFTLTLLKPIKFGKGDNSEIHTRIELHEPTLDQFDEFSQMARKKGEITALKHFIAEVSDTPYPIIGLMGGRDMMLAQEYLLAFFRGSQTTGDTSPE
ncbi:phage tail assembly protein [Paraburkholderia silviterrae]|uniref:Phage tail assembly protein n=1 Tax=Paraburkholderia silviterrae TaxID=2528715 RepID=A0A4R5M9C3_9BURK|nr:phage tail assembly protein [Paraburkholderia silviterrae]TDG23217.1 phage tail assembly protein [Paraburkholderia silviterrae]